MYLSPLTVHHKYQMDVTSPSSPSLISSAIVGIKSNPSPGPPIKYFVNYLVGKTPTAEHHFSSIKILPRDSNVKTGGAMCGVVQIWLYAHSSAPPPFSSSKATEHVGQGRAGLDTPSRHQLLTHFSAHTPQNIHVHEVTPKITHLQQILRL